MPSLAALRPAAHAPLGQRAPHRLARALMQRIGNGALSDGDWLPAEHELLSEFSVSRATLREALIILECLGQIESHHGVGCRVIGRRHVEQTRPSPDFGVTAFLQACRAFEAEAAGLAASLTGSDGLSPSCPRPSIAPLPTVATCREFHACLAHATGNGAIAASVENLWSIAAARPEIMTPLNAALARSRRTVRTLQRNLLEAITSGCPAQAREAANTLFDGYLAAVPDLENHQRPKEPAHEEAQPRAARA